MSHQPTWRAGSAAWWSVTAMLAGLAIAALTLMRTVQAASAPEPATAIFEAALRPAITETITAGLADPAAERIRVRHDLVDIDVDAEQARRDFDRVVDRATAERAAELRERGVPADPGISRTTVGVPRRMLEAMTAQNHDALGDAVRWTAIIVVAMLAWTLLQARDDNLLVLPAAALAIGWLLTRAALGMLSLLLTDVSAGSSTVVRVVRQASAGPVQQSAFLAAAAIAASMVYRLLTLARLRWTRRRARPVPIVAPSPEADLDAHDAAPGEPVETTTVGELEDAAGTPERTTLVVRSRREPLRVGD